jgi:hypothetical protein
MSLLFSKNHLYNINIQSWRYIFIVLDRLVRYKIFALVVCLFPLSGAAQSSLTWNPIGPTGATVYDLEVNSSGVVFAASTDPSGLRAEVYKKDPGSSRWESTNLDKEGVAHVVHINEDNLYVGVNSFVGGSVYMINNKNSTWEKVGDNIDSQQISSIVSIEDNLVVGTFGGIYELVEDSDEWVLAPGVSSRVVDIAMYDESFVACTSRSGIFIRSQDGSWSPDNSGSTASRITACGTSINGVTYVFGEDVVERRTVDGVWETVEDGIPTLPSEQSYIEDFYPTSNGLSFAAQRGGNVISINDNETTWSYNMVNYEDIYNSIPILTVLVQDDGNIVVGTDPVRPIPVCCTVQSQYIDQEVLFFWGGVFEYNENNDEWLPVNNGLSIESITDLAITEDLIWTLSENFGIFQSGFFPTDWKYVSLPYSSVSQKSILNNVSGLDNSVSIARLTIDNVVEIWIRYDDGSWARDDNEIPSGIPLAMHIDFLSDSYISIDNNGLYTKAVGSDVWMPIDFSGEDAGNILCIYEHTDGVVYIGSSGGGIYTIKNSSINFVRDLGSPVIAIESYFGEGIVANTIKNIFLFDDLDSSWRVLQEGLPKSNFSNLDLSQFGLVVSSSEDGLYLQTSAGDKWRKVANPNDDEIINIVNEPNENLYVLTPSSVYQTRNLVPINNEGYNILFNEGNHDLILYPNPFSSHTVIDTIELLYVEDILIQNTLGQVIYRIKVNRLDKKFPISIPVLAAGTYVISIISGGVQHNVLASIVSSR